MAKSRKKSEAPKEQSKPKPAAGASPLLDTDLAASAVAKILLAKSKMQDTGSAADSGRESDAFKQLKEGLNKPASLAAANSLNAALGHSKADLPRRFGKNSSHGQVVGHAGPSNVPRRTNG